MRNTYLIYLTYTLWKLEMSQSYNKPCRDCKQQITMMEMNGKWGAYNLDGSYHQCESKKQESAAGTEVKEKQKQPLTLQEIDVRLKRVEAMLFNGGK